MRTHKIIKIDDDHEIRICGTNRWQMVHTEFNDETDDVTNFVNHYGRKYSLDEFVLTKRNPWGDAPKWMQEFDGSLNDSFFSGVLIKLSDCGESAKVFTFIS